MPEMLMEFIYLCSVSEDVDTGFMMYAEFMTHHGNILLPFICAGSMLELKNKIKKIFPCGRRQFRVVKPQILILAHRTDAQHVKTTTVIRCSFLYCVVLCKRS